MNSMTGFGCAEGEGSGIRMAVEIKSLNSRYLDVLPILPQPLSKLEPRIREFIQTCFHRGRLEISVKTLSMDESLDIVVDRNVALRWMQALDEVSAWMGKNQEPTLEMLIQQEGVFKVEKNRDAEACWAVLEPLLTSAAEQVAAHRRREGAHLARDAETQIALIENSLKAISHRIPAIRSRVEESLKRRFTEIIGDAVDEQRVLHETAAWIVKTDINEEIVRLGAHISAFRDEAAGTGPQGKKLDFLAQEIGREINTIGSKSYTVEVSQDVVTMKDSLERVREQIRNVE